MSARGGGPRRVRFRGFRGALGVAAVLAVASGCASYGTVPHTGAFPDTDRGMRSGEDQVSRPDSATIAALEALYQARAEAALQGHHDADVHFMAGMIGHHAQALVMAGFAPEAGASPAIQTLCARIINAQRDEINAMQAWLRDRGLAVPEVHISDGHLTIHGPEHAMHMPGMLTRAQLEELGRARGADFDRLFLEYMIMHHEGAVTMVERLFATDGAAQGDFVFKLASDIQADQGSEIARMELMLEGLSASSGR